MHLNIKSKIIGGYMITLGLLTAMGFFMSVKLSESNQRLLNIVDVTSKKINLSNEIMIAVLEVARNEKNIMFEKNTVQKDYFKDRIYRALDDVDEKTNALEELVDNNGKVILDEFKITWARYKPDLSKIISLAIKNEEGLAYDISINKGMTARDASISCLQRLIDKNKITIEIQKAQNNKNYNDAISLMFVLFALGLILAIVITYWITQIITSRISEIAKVAEKIAGRKYSNDILEDNTNDELKPIFNALISVNESFREVTEHANKVALGNYSIELVPRSEEDTLGIALRKMTRSLRETTVANEKLNWYTTGQNQLNEKLKGDQSIEELSNNTIGFLCTYLKANIGAVYLYNDPEKALILSGQYAFASPKEIKVKFAMNEGLIGEAAKEQKQISLSDLSENPLRITSSMLNVQPKHLLITPLLFQGKTVGVVEMGRLTDFTDTENEFIKVSMNSIAISVNSAIARKQIRELLEETQFQNIEKEKRASELGVANKELAYQNDEKEKRASELGIANKELAYQNDEKEKRASELGIANKELAYQNDEKEKRASELGIANKELAFQNDEKEKRASELSIANKELAYQNDEKEKRASELGIANRELAFQNGEKEKRAAELDIANIELAYQNDEKEKRAVELSFANVELSSLAEELQTQQEELKQMNEELEEQAQNLKQQQEELQMTNEELEEQTQSLEIKNTEVESAKNDIEQKTKQLEISSRYKSEFLANMSHELRTPLNSLLILSKDLSENRNKNLDDIQVESAEIIYKSGKDLLVLINEVLDLSKIEAGKMLLNIENVSLRTFANELIREFKHHAEQKGLKLNIHLGDKLPEYIQTDPQRLNQILKNLLSNAIKFTETGSVSIDIERSTDGSVIISVTDSGIGIPEDKQVAIFEAFQQAEGGTSRKYGGTGLGLSISRELAKLLGAEIILRSKLNEGATFSLIFPVTINPGSEDISSNTPKSAIAFSSRLSNDPKYLNYPNIKDDRDTLTREDKTVLIIEDDLNFASILLKLANNKGFKCLSAASGEDGLLLASKYKPQAIILDMNLPGISGHVVLFELKGDPSVRHIPVHIISAEERTLEPIKEGAVEYLMKPVEKKDLEEAFSRIENFVDRKIKNLLIIEDSENSRIAMRLLIGNGDVKCFEAGTGKEALDIYGKNHIDCMILDIGLPDMSGFELIRSLEQLKEHHMPPVIVYTGKELTKEENNELQKYAESIIIKGVKSEERLLDEASLFLHRTISNLPKSKQMIINSLYDKEAVFHAKKILLVDDDMRNLFALSKILKERGMEIIKAENGINALEMLDLHPDINLVLMDIMMPEMDGYEAMKGIRSQLKFKRLPVIALTAKAMKDDKQKCIDAGANDYITKPIDVERLLSLMRVWLSQ